MLMTFKTIKHKMNKTHKKHRKVQNDRFLVT